MSTDSKSEPAKSTSLVPTAGPGLNLDFYRRIADPIDAVNKLGLAFSQSHMFGCKNDSQGRVLAMACLTECRSPVELMREYHLIEGNLTMKSDVMLAKFRMAGGEHIVIERSPDRAAIELKIKRQRRQFAFTWEEAKAESYVYCRDGKSLKDNWSTPRRRMQMLWARVVSDAVRVLAPECIAGYYTPEDLGYHEDDIIDVSAEPVAEKPAAEYVNQGAEDKAMEEAATKAAAAHPAMEDRSVPEAVTHDQLVEMKQLKDSLGYAADLWKQVLDKFGVTTAKDLDTEEAARLLYWLHKQADGKRAKNELEEWANEEIPY